jgi:SAM-dependent methyltransferase
MDDATTGQIPAEAAELYERFFVPALFDQWATRLLDLAQVARGHRVIDVGCGTGVLARAAYDVVRPSGVVEGLDLNPGMLAVARRIAPEIAWTQAAAENLPLDSGSVDRVLSQFALMFFSDADAAVSEMARVLRPGGRVCVATWAELDANPGYAGMVRLLRDLVGEAAAEALTAPYRLGSAADVLAVMRPAFPDVSVVALDGTARFDSVEAWVRTDIRAWTLGDLIDDQQFAVLLREAPHALAEFCDASGRVAFPVTALAATSG